MVLAALQYLPQIWTTFRRRSIGSLSLITMCLQTPGSFVFAYSIARRPGTNWSSWVLFVVTGSLQGLLLLICIYFKVRDKYHIGERRGILREQRARLLDEEEDERTALLESETGRE